MAKTMEDDKWIETWGKQAEEWTMAAQLEDLLEATITNLLAAWRRRNNTWFHAVRQFLYNYSFHFPYPKEEDNLSALLGAIYWAPPYPGSLKHWLDELGWDNNNLIQGVG